MTIGKVNEVLSKSMHVKPLGDKETVIFRLLATGKKDYGRKTEDGIDNVKGPSYQLVGTKQVYDRFKKDASGNTNPGMVVIANVTGTKAVRKGDKVEFESIISPVYFNSTGHLMLTAKDNDTYAFLMRCDENKSNPFRDKKKKAVFELVDKRAQAKKENDLEDFTFNAKSIVIDAPLQNLLEIAEAFDDIPKDTDIEIVKNRLLKKCVSEPLKVIGASNNRELKIKVQIKEAEDMLYIFFDGTTKTWKWMDGGEDITQVDATIDPRKGLIAFLGTKDGSKAYNKMASLIKKHYKLTEQES